MTAIWRWPQFFMIGWLLGGILIQAIRATRPTGPCFRGGFFVGDIAICIVLYFGGFWG